MKRRQWRTDGELRPIRWIIEQEARKRGGCSRSCIFRAVRIYWNEDYDWRVRQFVIETRDQMVADRLLVVNEAGRYRMTTTEERAMAIDVTAGISARLKELDAQMKPLKAEADVLRRALQLLKEAGRRKACSVNSVRVIPAEGTKVRDLYDYLVANGPSSYAELKQAGKDTSALSSYRCFESVSHGHWRALGQAELDVLNEEVAG